MFLYTTPAPESAVPITRFHPFVEEKSCKLQQLTFNSWKFSGHGLGLA